jgi:hypothetical protein
MRKRRLPGSASLRLASLGVRTAGSASLSRSLCACRDVWSAAAMLPRQPRSPSGACHTVDPAGFIKITALHHSHPTTSSTPSRCASAGFLEACASDSHPWECAPPGVRASGSHPWECAPLGARAFPARDARVATFGVRQHGCRTSRAHHPARVTPLILLAS